MFYRAIFSFQNGWMGEKHSDIFKGKLIDKDEYEGRNIQDSIEDWLYIDTMFWIADRGCVEVP